MKKIKNISIGDTFKITRTFAESDVYLFAGLSGDCSPNHLNEEFCKKTFFKTRIVHGCLTFGLTSAVATMAINATGQVGLSIGYDRVRFIKPVFIGDTITAVYTVDGIDEERMRVTANIELFNQKNELVLVARHLLKILDFDE